MTDQEREKARTALEDAVYRALDAGMTPTEIRDDVTYLLDTIYEEDA